MFVARQELDGIRNMDGILIFKISTISFSVQTHKFGTGTRGFTLHKNRNGKTQMAHEHQRHTQQEDEKINTDTINSATISGEQSRDYIEHLDR